MTGLSNGGTSASYTYNGDGVHVGKTVNGTATSDLQDLAAGLPVVMAETTGANTTQYVYGSDMIAQVNGSTPSYYHDDGLGSTRAMTDSTGTSTDQYTYDAFGATRSHNGSSTNTYTYTGQQNDPEANLVFLRARYYDPSTGELESRDPVAGFITRPASLNRYVYCGNAATSCIDYSGKTALDILGLVEDVASTLANSNSSSNNLNAGELATNVTSISAGAAGMSPAANSLSGAGAIIGGISAGQELNKINQNSITGRACAMDVTKIRCTH